MVALPASLTTLVGEKEQAEAAALTDGLKRVHTVISSIQRAGASGKDEKLKALWILGRYGEISRGFGGLLSLNNERFKQYAWGTTRGRRVFTQLEEFGVRGDYSDDEDADGRPVTEVVLKFDDDPDDMALYS